MHAVLYLCTAVLIACLLCPYVVFQWLKDSCLNVLAPAPSQLCPAFEGFGRVQEFSSQESISCLQHIHTLPILDVQGIATDGAEASGRCFILRNEQGGL